MQTSRRSLFGMLVASPVVIPEMVKSFKEELPASVEKTHCPPRHSGCDYESYGGGFRMEI